MYLWDNPQHKLEIYKMNEAIVYFDGGIRNSKMALGFAVYENEEFYDPTKEPDKELFCGHRKCGRGSSNLAEYRALIAALMECLKREIKIVHVYGDSQLIVRQITGASKTNNKDLIEHRDKSLELLNLFENYSIKWIPRKYNKRSDQLVNQIFEKCSGKISKKNKNRKRKND